MAKKEGLKLTAAEIEAAFSDPTVNAKPVLTIDEVAELLSIPKQTIYSWHSQGQLKGCCRKVGKHLRFFRNRLMAVIFNEGVNSDGK